DLHISIDQPGAVLPRPDLWSDAFPLRGHLAHDGFQDIDDRDHADHAAKFIRHDGEVLARLAEGFEQLHDSLSRRNEQGLDHQGSELHGEVRINRFDGNDADNVIAVALIDGEVRVPAGYYLMPDLLMGIALADEHHLWTRGHNFLHQQLVEFEDARDHFGF